MRSHFDPDFSHQAAAGMIPLFSTEIARWIDELSAKAANANGGFVEDVVKASKLLSFRLISLTVYGDAFDETVWSSGASPIVTKCVGIKADKRPDICKTVAPVPAL
jgi:cytochrome P450